MPKIAKPILISLGVAIALTGLLFLAANIYLQSGGVQGRITEAVSDAVGAPVAIRSAAITPWSGLSVVGILVPAGPDAKAPLLDIASVDVRLGLLELLAGRVVVEEIIVKDPVLTAFQKPDGSWSRPQAAATPAATPLPGSVVPVPSPGPAVVEVPEAAPPTGEVTAPAAPRAGPRIALRKISIRDGISYLDDARGRRIGSIAGIFVTVHNRAPESYSGKFEVREIEVFGLFTPRALKGTFEFANGELVIPAFEAEWAGGAIAGSARIVPGPGATFDIQMETGGASLATIASEAGWSAADTDGKLFGKASLAGRMGHSETFAGRGNFELRDASLVPVDFVRQLGELMRIEELQTLHLRTAVAEFTVADQKVHADKVVLESENLVLEATGPVSFTGELDLDASLHFNRRLQRDLRALLGDQLKPSAREDYAFLPFEVSGTVAKPRSDLLDKIAGARLGRDVGGFLKNLLRAPQEKKKATPTPGGGG